MILKIIEFFGIVIITLLGIFILIVLIKAMIDALRKWH